MSDDQRETSEEKEKTKELDPVDSSDVTKVELPDLENLPEEKKAVIKQLLSVELSSMYSGPLPPAQQIERYETAIPGSGSRIIKLTEDQLSGRLKRENKETNSKILGQVFAFILVLALIVSGFFLAKDGNENSIKVALVIFRYTIIGVAGLFITRQYIKYQESKVKRD